MKKRLTVVLLTVAFLSACESTDIAPATGADASLEIDERRLWARAIQEEDVLDHSGFVAGLPQVEAYLNGVLLNLHPPALAEGAAWRVRIIVDPTLNAFALPNGVIYVHTGMLARLENEAQLATVLGHELTHVTHRHGLKGFRNLKNKTAFMAAFGAGTAGVGSLLGAIGAGAAVSGYARDLEQEADVKGFALVVAAGYDPRETEKVFRVLLAESVRSKIKEPFFFGSHPHLQERIASFEALIAALPVDRRKGRLEVQNYEAQLPEILLLNAGAALRAGDVEFAGDGVQRALKLKPNYPEAGLMLAEIQQKRGAEEAALRLYDELTKDHPDFAPGYRGLGLMRMKHGDLIEAAAAFHHYLLLQPEAADRGYIENYLKQCEPKS